MAIAARSWQIDKSRFRHSLAGCTVTIHEHLDRTMEFPAIAEGIGCAIDTCPVDIVRIWGLFCGRDLDER